MRSSFELGAAAALCALLFLCGPARGQNASDSGAWSDDLLGRMTRSDFDGAYAMLRHGSRLGATRGDALGALRENMTNISRAYGAGLRYEFVRRSALGESTHSLTYVLIRERAPVVVQLVFSRSSGDWNLIFYRTIDGPQRFPFEMKRSYGGQGVGLGGVSAPRAKRVVPG